MLSWVKQPSRFCKPKVGGSSPSGGTTISSIMCAKRQSAAGTASRAFSGVAAETPHKAVLLL